MAMFNSWRPSRKSPAPIQYSAKPRGRNPPTQAENHRCHRRKREDSIPRFRWNKSVWVKYARWEESQKDCRSVWDRALEMDYRDHTLWLKYAEFEMRNKFVNQARNLLDLAVELLHSVDQLWCKYFSYGRRILDRWMGWSPDQQARQMIVDLPKKLKKRAYWNY